MKLINPTDDELNAAFAEKVAGWRCFKEQRGDYALCVCYEAHEQDPFKHWNPKEEALRMARYSPVSCIEAVKIGFFGRSLPKFTRSFDAVLPWLEKMASVEICQMYSGGVRTSWAVDVSVKYAIECAQHPFLPRAAVVALLRAHGIEVEFTQQAAVASNP